MAGVNKVIVVGRLGKDPETKIFNDGNMVCNFSVATSEEWKDKTSGEKRERTEWHKIVVYGNLASVCEKWLKKGRQVYIEGRIQTREYEKGGEKRYITEIITDKVQFLGDKGQKTEPAKTENPYKDTPPPESDIPF